MPKADAAARRRSWFGSKRVVKAAISLPVVHAVLRFVARRALDDVTRARLPAPRGPVRGRVRQSDFVMLRPDRCTVAKELYWGGGQRPRAEEAVALDLAVTMGHESEIFLDIGAYTGVFSLAVAASCRDVAVHAYEVVPDVYELLFRNIVANDLVDRITLHCRAVWRSGDTIRMAAGLPGSSLPTSLSVDAPGHGANVVDIPSTSLDDIGADLPDGAAVSIKIDVENAELELLRHGTDFLARRRPAIICEVLRSQSDHAELDALLRAAGYLFWVIGPEGPERRDRLVPEQGKRDWVLLPEDGWNATRAACG